MTLDSTLHLTVRQKARFGSDAFIGTTQLLLSQLRISKQPLKNWYKLGPKPGKTSAKVRGDLLVTIQFLSRWNEKKEIDENPFAKLLEAELHRHNQRPFPMLRRTKSEYQAKSGRDPFRSVVDKATSAKPKEKFSGVFKRSFRKKNPQVFEDCEDDFVSLAVRSPDSPPTPPHQSNRRKVAKVTAATMSPGNPRAGEELSSDGLSQSESSNQDSLTSNSSAMFTEASKLNKTSGIIDLWRADPDVRREVGRQQLEQATDRSGEEKDSDSNHKKKSPIFRSNVYHRPRPQSMLTLPVTFKTQDKVPRSSEEESTDGPLTVVSHKNSIASSSPTTESPSHSPTFTYLGLSFQRARRRGNSINRDAGMPEAADRTPARQTPDFDDNVPSSDPGPVSEGDKAASNEHNSSTSSCLSASSTTESVTPDMTTSHQDNSASSTHNQAMPLGERVEATSGKPGDQKKLKQLPSDKEETAKSDCKEAVAPGNATATDLPSAEEGKSRLEDESHPMSPVSSSRQGLRPRILPFVGSSSPTPTTSPGRKRAGRSASLAVEGGAQLRSNQHESEKLLPEAVPLRKKRPHAKGLGVSANFDWKRRSADITELRKLTNGQSNTDGLGNIMSLQAPLRELILQKKVPEPQASDTRPGLSHTPIPAHPPVPASNQPGGRWNRAATAGHSHGPPSSTRGATKHAMPTSRPVRPHRATSHHHRAKSASSVKSEAAGENVTTTSASAPLNDGGGDDVTDSCQDNQGARTPPLETESLDNSRSTTPQPGQQQTTPPSSAPPVSVTTTTEGEQAPSSQGSKNSDEQMKRLKHTVTYKKSQGKPLSGVSLLPPSVSSKSATLPSRGKFAGSGKDRVPTFPGAEPPCPPIAAAITETTTVTDDVTTETVTPEPSPVPTVTPDVLSPVSEVPSISSSQALSPVGEGEDSSLHEEAVLPIALSPPPSETPVHRSSTSSMPSSSASHVAKAFLDVLPLQRRKQGGGLKRAMSLYQENRRQVALIRGRMNLEPGTERATHSAGNSPHVRRRETIDGMNSLRRLIMRHSSTATPPLVMHANGSRCSTPDSTVTGGTGSPLSFRRISDHAHFLRFPVRFSSTSPAPNDRTSGALSPTTVPDGLGRGPGHRHTREPLLSTTSSTTETEHHSRLSKGCSSSFETDERASEEGEELTEDVLQTWSKEDLIHELLRTRSNYRATKKESASVQEYLGDLLAKVMQHSPELLQCTHTEH